MAINMYLSIIALNVNGLNSPIKRHRLAEWIRSHNPYICCVQKTHLRTKDLPRLKVKGWTKIFQANGQGKKNQCSNTYIKHNRLQHKDHKKRHRITLHNPQGKNPSKRYKHYKRICTQYWRPRYIRRILEDFKKDINTNILIVENFSTLL